MIMNYSEKINHYISCMLFYYKTMLYKKGDSYYINENVDKTMSFKTWFESLSDEEIMYNCDNDKDINAEEIRTTLDKIFKNWINNNCKGDLL